MIRALLFGLVVFAAVVAGFAIVALIADWVNLTVFGLVMVVGFLVLWTGVLFDVWRRADLSSGSRVLWSVAIVILPILGSIVYAMTRPVGEQVRYRGEQIT
jgi:hypothetical protein